MRTPRPVIPRAIREIPSREQVLRNAFFIARVGATGPPAAAVSTRLDYRPDRILRTVTQGPKDDETPRPMIPVIPAVRAAFARRLAAYERRSLSPPNRLEYRPLFVISLPRSGSTLFYQLLLQRFRLAYFSNLMAAFPDSPVTVARLSRGFGGSTRRRISRALRATRGWRGPNQGWRLWNRWLPGPGLHRPGEPRTSRGRRDARDSGPASAPPARPVAS